MQKYPINNESNIMDTNKLIRDNGYVGHENFGMIATLANELAKENYSEAAILATIAREYSAPNLLVMDSPKDYTVFGKELIETNAIEQMDQVMSIPPALHGAIMPDGHLGYGMPIGGVAILDNAISPNFVGFDIACRMKMTIFKDILYTENFDKDEWLSAMRQSTKFGVGCKWPKDKLRDHNLMYDPRFKELGYDMDKVRSQLGTSGKGNHFLDIVSGNFYDTPQSKFVALITHSGSRGPGYQTARKYNKLAKEYTDSIARDIPKGYEWLSMDTDQGKEYFMAMNLMGEYAQASHDLIHESFMKITGTETHKTYDNHHNFCWRIPGTNHYIHRKGATPAGPDIFGIIPGSSGSASYLVRGLGNKQGLYSAPHGAGRPYSRTEAKSRHNVEDFKTHMESEQIRHKGITGDETVFAYKDIEKVIEASKDLILPIAYMWPKIVLMGGGGR